MTLFEIAKQIKLPVPILIDQIRAHALTSGLSDVTRVLCQKHHIYVPEIKGEYSKHSDIFIREAKKWMSDYRYHLANRLRGNQHFQELLKMFPEYQDQANLKDYLNNSYDLSILPINLAPGLTNAVKYFLPQLNYQSKVDPYAIKHSGSVITDETESGSIYVATRKPRYGTYLLTLTVPWTDDPTKGTFICPIGCRTCYRGIETRFKSNIKITDTGEDLASSKVRAQTQALVKKWQPEVYDLLVSGGEPLLFPNKVWKESIIDIVKKCPHLMSLRICTGTLGHGLFARLDDEFLNMLVELRNSTGIQVAINCHISHPDEFTPEMIEKALRCKRRGIRIMPQVPLVEGVNFFNHDLPRTLKILRRLARLSAFIFNDPIYKIMVDMQGSVSLIQAIRVHRSLFDRHQLESNIVKPISFELFVDAPTGNVNLSYHTLYAMKMRVEGNRVTYQIPHPTGQQVIWKEDLIPGINDDPRLLQQATDEKPVEED